MLLKFQITSSTFVQLMMIAWSWSTLFLIFILSFFPINQLKTSFIGWDWTCGEYVNETKKVFHHNLYCYSLSLSLHYSYQIINWRIFLILLLVILLFLLAINGNDVYLYYFIQILMILSCVRIQVLLSMLSEQRYKWLESNIGCFIWWSLLISFISLFIVILHKVMIVLLVYIVHTVYI